MSRLGRSSQPTRPAGRTQREKGVSKPSAATNVCPGVGTLRDWERISKVNLRCNEPDVMIWRNPGRTTTHGGEPGGAEHPLFPKDDIEQKNRFRILTNRFARSSTKCEKKFKKETKPVKQTCFTGKRSDVMRVRARLTKPIRPSALTTPVEHAACSPDRYAVEGSRAAQPGRPQPQPRPRRTADSADTRESPPGLPR